MIINMACPKCGGETTEYDLHKWSCLRCGNKFIYVPPPSPPTQNVANTVNVVGQPNYELDVQNAKPAKEIIKTRYENNPVEFSYPPEIVPVLDQQIIPGINSLGYGAKNFQELINRNRNSKTLWLFWTGLFCVLTIAGIATKSLLFLCVLPALVSLLNFVIRCRDAMKIKSMVVEAESRFRQSEMDLADFEARKNQKITVGHQPVCPFCMVDVANISTGLTHCPKCGKQFHYSNERSYPLKFR